LSADWSAEACAMAAEAGNSDSETATRTALRTPDARFTARSLEQGD
jgi:hypothetical protein